MPAGIGFGTEAMASTHGKGQSSAVSDRSRIDWHSMDSKFGSSNILKLACQVGLAFEERGFPYCWIGGVAVQRWAKPRQTVDVDAMIFAGFGDEKSICTQLLKIYPSRVEQPLQLAVEGRIVLLQDEMGTGIDISLGGLPYEQRVLERSSDWEVPEHGKIRTCCPEDLIVMKAIANRGQDWIDIDNTMTRQNRKLDKRLILGELRPLVELKEEPEIMDQLEQLFAQH